MALSFDPLGVLGGGPQDEPHSPPAPTVRARSSEAEQLGAVPSPSACTAGDRSLAHAFGELGLRAGHVTAGAEPALVTPSPEPPRRVSLGGDGAPIASAPAPQWQWQPQPQPQPAGSARAPAGAPATPLLAGERVVLHEPTVLDVSDASGPCACALFLTNHRVLVEAHAAPHVRALAVHVHAVSRLRRAHAPHALVSEHGGQGLGQRLDVHCRVNARPALRLQATDALVSRVTELLRQLRAQCTVDASFASAHAAALGGARDDGWAVYDAQAEFHRQGLLNPLSCWRVCEANRQYALCASYPPAIVVPKAIDDEALSASAAFRASGRFPALCWKDPHSFASISRAGQPLVGINGKRSVHDERLLCALLETNPECDTLAIVDCRPRLNAEANVLNGKGYESAANYQRTLLRFVDIQNIHVMRESMRRLLTALEPRGEGAAEWLRELSGCGWLEHVQAVLRGARAVVQLVLEHRSVLVHCSDGWDRTSQITALAQLQLDPYFRTLRGFAVLVEKEWLSFGHHFALRHGSAVHAHAPALGGAAGGAPTPGASEEQQSPVFVQFVDCVWQLTLCCPRAFEFSQLFLATVLQHVFSAQYGTFLLDTHLLRARAQLPSRTRSLWSDLLDAPAERGFVNPFYDPQGTPGALAVDLSGCTLEVFKAYYSRGPHTVHRDDVRDMADRALGERHRREHL
ncbi:hypothetical protein KFE25_012577 [Diacronema lutheri]|uniref:Myotubularin phosphatase domain-containing protein n=2 Tax=Diacronema lutheri TaxID=2081491 RepID=A0A8J5XRE8_DIALT|nr:hypothetical protein KFE25_012577 [Diacronema lutheri]